MKLFDSTTISSSRRVAPPCDGNNVDDDEDCNESSGDHVIADEPFSTTDPSVNVTSSSLPLLNVTAVVSGQPVRGASSKRADDDPNTAATGRRSVVGSTGTSSSSDMEPVDNSHSSSGGSRIRRLLTSAPTALIVGAVLAAAAVVMLASFGVYKYRSRDEGTYRLDPDCRDGYRPAGSGGPMIGNGGGSASSSPAIAAGGVTANGGGEYLDVDDGGGGTSSTRSGSTIAGWCGTGGPAYRLRHFRSRPNCRRDVKEWYV